LLCRTASSALFVLLAITTLTMTFRVQPARADGTIYIRANGSVDGTDKIASADNTTYTFTENLNAPLVVERSDIIIDGQGHVIQGNQTESGYGISWSSIDNVTVRNTNIEDCDVGIYVEHSSNSRIIGNNFTNGYVNSLALRISNSSGTKIDRNRIQLRFIQGLINGPGNNGIDLIFSNESIISNNIVETEWDWNMLYGGTTLLLESSTSNTIIQNDINSSMVVIHIVSSSSNRFYHNNFLRETGQVITDGSQNAWDNGYGSGGNYWSAHICDGNPSNGSEPYIINEQNLDHYPFQYPNGWLKVHNANSGKSYATIQEAVDAKETQDGHTILVGGGVYGENVVLSKSLTLIGNDRTSSIIESSWPSVEVHADNVVIQNLSIHSGGLNLLSDANYCSVMDNLIDNCDTGLTIVGATGTKVLGNVFINNNRVQHGWVSSAIEMHNAQDIYIANNSFDKNFETLWFHDSVNRNITIARNQVLNSYSSGISNYPWEFGSSWEQKNITILDNVIANSSYGAIWLFGSDIMIIGNTFNSNNQGAIVSMGIWGNNSLILHNNFLNNTADVTADQPTRFWNSSSEGNYWSDYVGMDLNMDGIGDTPYTFAENNTDYCPLMGRYSDFPASPECDVQIVSNSTIHDFQFNGTAVSFNVEGENDTTGFCRICIPKSLQEGPYRIFVNGTEVQYTILPGSGSSESLLYFTYHHSIQEVSILPEYSQFGVFLIFIIAIVLSVMFAKRSWNRSFSFTRRR